MEAARRLAATGDRSEVARTARSGLIGLRASLAEAVDRCPQDPGREPAMELIASLDEIIAVWPVPGPGGRAGQAGRAGPGRPEPPEDRRLSELAAAFVGDPAVAEFLDEQSMAVLAEPQAGTGLWRALHMCLLRLPEPVASRWRARCATLATPASAAAASGPGWRILPGESEVVLVPQGPPGAGQEDGIRTSADGRVDDEVLDALGLGRAGGREVPADVANAMELARLSTLVLDLTELDENLVMCLESVLFMGSKRIDAKHRQLYRADLLGRLREYARREVGTADSLEALIEIDEAINSLTHRPPAAAGSWWAQLRQQSRRMAERAAAAMRQAGADVEVLPLGLRYRDVRDFTAGNDVAARTGGKPGDVLACLRLWTRIGDQTIPGRVMYRA